MRHESGGKGLYKEPGNMSHRIILTILLVVHSQMKFEAYFVQPEVQPKKTTGFDAETLGWRVDRDADGKNTWETHQHQGQHDTQRMGREKREHQ